MSMVENIKVPEIKEFTVESLVRHGDGGPSELAEKTAMVLYDLLEEKGFIQEHTNQVWIDTLISAALLHDLFRSEDWDFIFDARKYLKEIAEGVGLPEQGYNGIFEAIESQLWDETPISKLRPQPGTPQELFAIAVFVAKKYLI